MLFTILYENNIWTLLIICGQANGLVNLNMANIIHTVNNVYFITVTFVVYTTSDSTTPWPVSAK